MWPDLPEQRLVMFWVAPLLLSLACDATATTSFANASTAGTPPPTEECNNTGLIVALLSVVASVIVLVVIILCLCGGRNRQGCRLSLPSWRRTTQQGDTAQCRPQYRESASGSSYVSSYSRLLWSNQFLQWLVAERDLQVDQTIKEGSHGVIARGVTIKNNKRFATMLKMPMSSQGELSEAAMRDFIQEAMSLRFVSHANVLQPLALCLPHHKDPIVAYACSSSVNLLEYLQCHQVDDSTRASDLAATRHLTVFALDISKALSFLATLRIVHGDVAARNCIVTRERHVKLSDSALASAFYPHHYQTKCNGRRLPLRWAAYEVAFQGHSQSLDADKWAFAVTVWEIYSGGILPYRLTSKEHIPELRLYLDSNGRLDRSGKCPAPIYEMMRQCWDRHPNFRPDMARMSDTLAGVATSLESPPDTGGMLLPPTQLAGSGARLPSRMAQHMRSRNQHFRTSTPLPEFAASAPPLQDGTLFRMSSSSGSSTEQSEPHGGEDGETAESEGYTPMGQLPQPATANATAGASRVDSNDNNSVLFDSSTRALIHGGGEVELADLAVSAHADPSLRPGPTAAESCDAANATRSPWKRQASDELPTAPTDAVAQVCKGSGSGLRRGAAVTNSKGPHWV